MPASLTTGVHLAISDLTWSARASGVEGVSLALKPFIRSASPESASALTAAALRASMIGFGVLGGANSAFQV